MRKPLRWSVVLGAGLLIASTCLVLTTSAVAAASKSPIVIGYIGDLTGAAAPEFADGPGGAQARIDLQNAEGGVDGHPLKLVIGDTQTSPTQAKVAAELLVQQDHVFAIVENSALFFGAAPYLAQENIPVTGTGIDGPEWSSDQNLFGALGPPISGPLGGHFYIGSTAAVFFKMLGATKIAGAAPSVPAASLAPTFQMLQKKGLTNCYLDDTQPIGTINVTATLLSVKHAGCDGFFTDNEDTSSVAYGQGIRDAGLNLKAVLLGAGYDSTILSTSTDRAAVQGDYVYGLGPNFTSPNAATRKLVATLKKYDGKVYKGGIPDLGLYGGYASADLMITGLKDAGATPTHASFIANLRKVSNYNLGGAMPSSFGFTHFGTPQMLPKAICQYYFVVEGDHFITANHGKPICGTYVKTTT